ncbi:MAG: PAS domain S-box protein [Spirochaetes bacterium]|nr:PAS domain S-box protein [Spirochaetota bacterium]MBU1081977.1 PAS domain S-box protein [Spirochaetota bacterium]
MDGKGRKTILLVEDEALIALDERSLLERRGYAVRLAYSGEEAVAAFETDDAIDLVLMDIDLGRGMDGTQAARAMLESRDVPVVFLSSHAEPEIVEKTENITSYGYILKNSSATVLDASIKMAFKLFDANARTMAVNRKLEATLDALPDLFFEVDAAGRYLDVHCPDPSLLVMPEEDLPGATIAGTLPPEVADILMESIREARARGSSKGRRYRLAVSAGPRCFEVSASRMESPSDAPRFIMICRDVTEQERADGELQASKQYVERLLNVSAEIILSTDMDGRITLLNDSGHRRLGYEPGELVGRQWAETCLSGETRAEVAAFLDGLLRGEDETLVAHENLVRLKSGELRSFLWHNTVLKDADGRPVGILSSGEDVSAYKELEERYRTIVEASPDSIAVTDLQGRIAMFSPKAVSMFGFDGDGTEHLGRYVTDFMAPEDRLKAVANIGRMAEGEVLGSEEYRGLRHDGSSFDMEINGAFIRDRDGAPAQILFIVRDISERKRLVGKYKMLFDLSPLGIALFDKESGRFLDANASLQRMLGYAKDELVRYSYMDLTAPEYALVTKANTLSFDGGASVARYSKEYVRKDGSRLPVSVSVALFEDDDHREVVWGIIEDVTERRAAEAKEAAMLAEKDLILKEVHHRIKNNFSVIKSLLGMQAGAAPDPKTAESFRTTESRVQSMALLYERLFESSNFLEASARDYLPALVHDIASNFPAGDRVAIITETDDIVLDAKRLQSLGILVNELVTNSMKYAFEGRGSGSLAVTARRAEGRIAVTVEDDGPGLPEGIEAGDSDGFGLSLVAMLARQLGGSMRVERGGGGKIVVDIGA